MVEVTTQMSHKLYVKTHSWWTRLSLMELLESLQTVGMGSKTIFFNSKCVQNVNFLKKIILRSIYSWIRIHSWVHYYIYVDVKSSFRNWATSYNLDKRELTYLPGIIIVQIITTIKKINYLKIIFNFKNKIYNF